MAYSLSVWGCLSTGRILYAEAEKAFVDILLSLLDLPVGRLLHIVRQRSRGAGVPGVVDSGANPALINMYDSLTGIEDTVLEYPKGSLLKPGLISDRQNHLLACMGDHDQCEHILYSCVPQYGSCSYMLSSINNVCPHKCLPNIEKETAQRKTLRKKIRQCPWAGYVKAGVPFIVTEDLQVFRSVTAQSTKVFLQMQVTNFEDVHVMKMTVGKEEILQIVKHSLTPRNGVLSAVFGEKFQEQVKEIRKSYVTKAGPQKAMT